MTWRWLTWFRCGRAGVVKLRGPQQHRVQTMVQLRSAFEDPYGPLAAR